MQQDTLTLPSSSLESSSLETAHELERWAGVAMATAVVAYGLSRRSLRGVALAAAAAPFAYRGMTGAWPGVSPRASDTRVALAGHRGIHVREAIRLEVPLEFAYGFWRRLENLPRFMEHLQAVRVIDDRRSHWRARAPAGTTVEWDAEIIEDRPNELIVWRSLDGADVPNTGSVRFTPAPGGRGTEVRVELRYDPPGGALGALVAKLFGEEPGQQVGGDLRRLKQVMETGEVVHSDASIHRGMHPARPSGTEGDNR